MLIDTHAHLDFYQFDEDRKEVIQRALSAGIEKIICPGCDLKSSEACVELAGKYDFIEAMVGVHPSDAGQWNSDVARRFFELIKGGKAIGIGEIGLDYYRMRTDEDLQKKVFREQLAIAKELGVPVCVHMRESAVDVYDVLIDSGVERVTLHCFNETLEFARKAWERGWVLGFGGPVTYPKNEELRRVVAEAPEGLFVLETDCPFLPPQKHRGERNEPAFVVEIAEEVRRVRDE